MARDFLSNTLPLSGAGDQSARPRIVMATHGSLGDLHPFIAVGRALTERGGSVVLASHPDYRAKVEAAGLPFRHYGASRQTYLHDLRLHPDEIIKGLTTDHGFLIKRLIAPYLEASIRDIAPAIAEADLVLGSSFAYGAHIAALKAGKPFTTIALQPTVMMSAYDPPKVKQAPFIFTPKTRLGRLWNRLIIKTGEQVMAASQSRVREVYKQHGLTPDISLGGIISDHQTLALYSPLMGGAYPDFPPHTAITGFPFYDNDDRGEARLPEALEAFLDSGPAPIAFSLGSAVVYGGEAFYRDAIAAAKALASRCVVLVGPESPLLHEDLGADVCAVPYAPHSKLFPRASVVVHHGGIGSTAQALRAGRPQLVTPVFGDQFDNGFRVEKLGVGQVLTYDRWTAKTAAKALRSLLHDADKAAQAARCAEAISDEDGAQAAADVIMASVG